MTETLTSEDEQILQIAAHGVVSLMASADPGAISSTKAGIAGGKAMSSATGLVGHLLAKKPKKLDLKGNVAEQADTVLPALTRSVEILAAKAPGEVDNFRRTIDTVVQSAAQAHGNGPNPAQTEMIRKITAALGT